jgi:hypothetical protein
MPPLPTADLRTQQGTWIVPVHAIPTVAQLMLDNLPVEQYDPAFQGQELESSYFDDRHYTLRKARVKKDRYITIRLRCYDAPGRPDVYAISAKTESEKWRQEIPSAAAEASLAGSLPIKSQLPPHLAARLVELDAEPLLDVVCVRCHRFAVEDDTDRLTLDLHVNTDRRAELTYGVLEYKADNNVAILNAIEALGLAPLKLSKFLWATRV